LGTGALQAASGLAARLVVHPFGSTIYVIAAIFLLAMALIGYGTFTEMPLAILIGAVLGVGAIVTVLYVISNTRFS
jgi:Zn-dependent protease